MGLTGNISLAFTLLMLGRTEVTVRAWSFRNYLFSPSPFLSFFIQFYPFLHNYQVKGVYLFDVVNVVNIMFFMVIIKITMIMIKIISVISSLIIINCM